MNIVLLCATNRGLVFLEKLHQLIPDATLTVFSFKETDWEPAYINKIASFTRNCGGRFFQSINIAHKKFHSFWQTEKVDLILVVNWRYIIPPLIYKKPRMGTYVFHDSLLPRYRGFSPTVWAIINGEDYTGVSLFEIAKSMDSGDIVDQKKIQIAQNDTISTVMNRVTKGYLDMLKENINSLLDGTIKKRPQDHSIATYTCKRLPEDNLINWNTPSVKIFNLIRAVCKPYPGAFTFIDGTRIIVWNAKLLDKPKNYVGSIPGRVVEIKPFEGAVVQTGDGSILLTEIQKEDDEIQCASRILNSLSQTLGT